MVTKKLFYKKIKQKFVVPKIKRIDLSVKGKQSGRPVFMTTAECVCGTQYDPSQAYYDSYSDATYS